ncbi:MAG TPA: prolyl oligopeptidase family serine peptidase [Terriglobales bacterium]|nr:prolyl oligopeptidase family serine peptidase [Terriglobales bacterium]
MRQLFRLLARLGQTCLLLFFLQATVLSAAPPEEVKFPSGKLTLHGFLYRPQGNGPFPAILYNHGSEEKPGSKPPLGEFFSSKGYVFFVPHRRGQGRSPNDSYVESLRAQGVAGAIALHETHLEDQLAALTYLKQLPSVDPQRIAVAGCSYGGIQSVLAVEANAEQKLGLRAAIDFAGGAESWRSLTLRSRMVRAIRKADIPVLFIQAENDYDLGPSKTLAGELAQLNKPHKLLIFPPYGNTREEGHGGFCSRATNVWGTEVLSFLDLSMTR